MTFLSWKNIAAKKKGGPPYVISLNLSLLLSSLFKMYIDNLSIASYKKKKRLKKEIPARARTTKTVLLRHKISRDHFLFC